MSAPEGPGGPVRYRVLAPCRVGRYRGPGDEFECAPLDPCPDYLEAVAPGDSPQPDGQPPRSAGTARPRATRKNAAAPGFTPNDMGLSGHE